MPLRTGPHSHFLRPMYAVRNADIRPDVRCDRGRIRSDLYYWGELVVGAVGLVGLVGDPPNPDPLLDPKPLPLLDPKPDPLLDPNPDPLLDPNPDPLLDPNPEPLLNPEPLPEPLLNPPPAEPLLNPPGPVPFPLLPFIARAGRGASAGDCIRRVLVRIKHEFPFVVMVLLFVNLDRRLLAQQADAHDRRTPDRYARRAEGAAAAPSCLRGIQIVRSASASRACSSDPSRRAEATSGTGIGTADGRRRRPATAERRTR